MCEGINHRNLPNYKKVKGQSGFTLLEMLVALSLFSLAALSLVKLQAYTIRTTSDIEQNSIARIVIQNLAVDILTDPNAPNLGSDSGTITNAGQEWQWTRNTQLTDDARLMRIDVRVSGKGALSPQILTLIRPVQQ